MGDASFQEKSREALVSFRRAGKSLLFVSHSPASVRDMCDRAVWIDHGAVMMAGSVENVLDALPATARPTFYRTSAGAEVDLVIEFSAKERWAVEIKRSLGNPAPSRGFYIGCGDVQATRQIVLYPGDERFSLDAKTEVMSLQTFMSDVLPERTA